MLVSGKDACRNVVGNASTGELLDGGGQGVGRSVARTLSLQSGLKMAHVLEDKHIRPERLYYQEVLVYQGVPVVTVLPVDPPVHSLLAKTGNLRPADPAEALAR